MVPGAERTKTVMTLFGTRPEIIKLAPVIRALEAKPGLRAISVSSGQHTELLVPFIRQFGLRIDRDLRVMAPGQSLNGLATRVLGLVDTALTDFAPDLVLVQGDTTTAMAGALACFHRRIPVGHVEAGLRSGDPASPYPEEVNRRVISSLASWHFAATEANRKTLLREGVSAERVLVTGNPVVDSLEEMIRVGRPSERVRQWIADAKGARTIVLTTHRRESFGTAMRENLGVLGRFVERHPEAALIFPVHPNPEVRSAVEDALQGRPRVLLVPPMDYEEFIQLLSSASLIVSDSGGIQEEAPTLRKPLLVLRENTERPEAIESGAALLVGGDPAKLEAMLEAAWVDDTWESRLAGIRNPFGDGNAGHRIAEGVRRILSAGSLGVD